MRQFQTGFPKVKTRPRDKKQGATAPGLEARLEQLLQVPGRPGASLRARARRFYRARSTLVEYERGHRLASLNVADVKHKHSQRSSRPRGWVQ